jgi:hypothetical protein
MQPSFLCDFVPVFFYIFTTDDVVVEELWAWIYAEVVTCVASSLEAGGLPGYPES